MTTFDFIIIGGGIVGWNMAYSLARTQEDLNIALVDGGDRYSEAAGAMISTITELSRRDPCTSSMTESFLAAGRFFHNDWIAQLSPSSINLAKGIFYLANIAGGNADLEEISYLENISQKYRIPYTEVRPADIPYYKPAKDYLPLKAVLFESDMSVDAIAYLKEVRNSLSDKVSLFGDRVTSLSSGNACHKVSLTNSTTLTGRYLICAAGIASASLLRNYLPFRLVIHRQHGIGVDLLPSACKGPFSCIRTPTRGFACGHHLVSRKDSIYLGSTSTYSIYDRNHYNAGDLDGLLSRGAAELNQSLSSMPVKKVHVGYRPLTTDKRPVIDEVTEGLFLITGFYRNSFLLSPYFSTMLARQILLNEDQPALNQFRMDRLRQPSANRLQDYLSDNRDYLIQSLIDNLERSHSESEQQAILARLYDCYLRSAPFDSLQQLPFPEALSLINTFLANGK